MSRLVVGLAVAAALLTGCNKARFSGSSDSGTSALASTAGDPNGSGGNPNTGGVPTCSVQQNTRPARIIFMVDNSNSTLDTDPHFQNRVATVQDFLNSYGSKTNLTYNYSYFWSSTVSYNMVTGGTFVANPANPFGNASQAEAALTLFESSSSKDGTGYAAAFNKVTSIIQTEEASTSNEVYVVVFMSDGQPTDLGNSASSQISGITTTINNLIAKFGANRVSVSSVYFGPANDAQSINNLATMAKLGGGLFVNSNNSTSFSIDNLINVPGPCL